MKILVPEIASRIPEMLSTTYYVLLPGTTVMACTRKLGVVLALTNLTKQSYSNVVGIDVGGARFSSVCKLHSRMRICAGNNQPSKWMKTIAATASVHP